MKTPNTPPSREGVEIVNCDPKSYELAEYYFLSDHSNVGDATARLALHIQQAIEDCLGQEGF